MANTTPFGVITGASRGIGAEYARALAAQGYDLLLVARDRTRLEEIGQELRDLHSVQVWTDSLDLAKPGAAVTLHHLALSHHPHVSLLINNAGFGLYGSFFDMPLTRIQDMIELHIQTIVESTRFFLPDMVTRQEGAIITVASVAGYFPIPYMAEYAATKAFLIAFFEALAIEIQNHGVKIQVCCPGYTATDFHQTAGHHPHHVLPPQSPKDVVQTSLNALKYNKTLVTIGWPNRMAYLISRIFPQKLLMRLISRLVKPKSPRH